MDDESPPSKQPRIESNEMKEDNKCIEDDVNAMEEGVVGYSKRQLLLTKSL